MQFIKTKFYLDSELCRVNVDIFCNNVHIDTQHFSYQINDCTGYSSEAYWTVCKEKQISYYDAEVSLIEKQDEHLFIGCLSEKGLILFETINKLENILLDKVTEFLKEKKLAEVY
jgi:hypothetical protein